MENPETGIMAQAQGLRKYFYEMVLIALASAVVSLALMYNNLNGFIRDTLSKQQIEQTRVIERNTDAFNVFIIHSQQIQQR